MSGPLAFCDRRVVAFRVNRLGRGRSPVVEIYHVYPDVGPPGTPNRGPYCVDLVRVLAPNVEAFLELLVSRGAVPLSEVDT